MKKLNYLILAMLVTSLASCKPFKPDKPDIPDNPPVEPDKPDIPDVPDNPDNPDDPDTPKETIYDTSKYYDGYYSSLVSWENSEDLIEKLYNIISKDKISLPYTWEVNTYADQDLYDFERIDTIYSQETADKLDTNSKWQREHCFPASLMCGTTTGNAVKYNGRATDYHNLYAGNSSANSSRGNKNYGVANKSDSSYVDRTTLDGYDGYSFDSKNFEPGDKDKGKVARAIFYMATMYKNDSGEYKGLKIVEDYVNYLEGESCLYSIGNLSTLINWNGFSVDYSEYQHNEIVFKKEINGVKQGNRNPYVDYPQLVDYVFGEKKNVPGKLELLKPTAVDLKIDEDSINRYSIYSAKRVFDNNEIFNLKDDIKIVAVKNNFEFSETNNFNIDKLEDNKNITLSGINTITISTDINTIKYDINVETDKILNSTYYHKLTAKSNGNDFYGINTKNNTINKVLLGDVYFNVYWQEGEVTSNNKLGCTFGTSSKPVKKLTFTSIDNFKYDNKSLIKGIYLRGSSGSGDTVTVRFKINNNIIDTIVLGFIDSGTNSTIGITLDNPIEGIVEIEIINITKAVYVDYIAIDLI